jgi:enoyl-[acyl-carrier-protein] reductase (NADH)
MGKMLALELAPSRVGVNVCPNHIPLADAGGAAEQVAELVLFLLSSRARHITGTPVWIDGGQSLMLG